MNNFLLFSILAMVFMGCRKPDPTPEIRDPIYLDIQSQLKAAQGEVKSAMTEFKENEANLEKIEPYTRQSKTFWQKYWASQKKLRKAEQKLHFLNLHLINRKYEARNSYIRAYNIKAEADWPSSSQFRRYKLNKRLKNAPRTWDSENIARQINESQ